MGLRRLKREGIHDTSSWIRTVQQKLTKHCKAITPIKKYYKKKKKNQKETPPMPASGRTEKDLDLLC